ncbi:restriction endonuclease subunit S [Yersinia canariae]|uniref:restriction endonuclease subunit S n=1 Tax=Yersinia canariae TaxID=2607663 RepID=UPI0015F2B6C6|nr:restriction endonuclease subunit S [Yersinia canariae]
MGSNWPLKSLKELGVSLIDCVHKTPTAVDDGVPYIGIPQMKGGTIDFSAKPRLISEDDYQLWTVKAKPTYGDIVLSRRCNPGETAYVPQGCKFALGQNLVLLRPDPAKIHPGYLRWVVNSPIWWEEVSKYKNPGAIFDSLKCADIPNFEVPEPTYAAQVLIDKCLLGISDKIELNHQINQTLEQIAQTLFKSWFIDFDPVIDNSLDAGFFEQDLEFSDELLRRAEARKAVRESTDFKPLPEDIRQLFPTAFEECSEPSLGLDGWVPKGWRMCKLSDFGAVVCGKTPSKQNKSFYGNDIPFIKIPDMHGNTFITRTSDNLSFDGSESQIKKLIPKNSICVSCIATVGLVSITTKPAHTNQQINSLIPRHEYFRDYLYFSLLNKNKQFHDLASGGSTTLNMNTRVFSNVPLINPDNAVLQLFQKESGALLDRVKQSSHEVDVLATLRDTLLPKLISGELRLDEEDITKVQAI